MRIESYIHLPGVFFSTLVLFFNGGMSHTLIVLYLNEWTLRLLYNTMVQFCTEISLLTWSEIALIQFYKVGWLKTTLFIH